MPLSNPKSLTLALAALIVWENCNSLSVCSFAPTPTQILTARYSRSGAWMLDTLTTSRFASSLLSTTSTCLYSSTDSSFNNKKEKGTKKKSTAKHEKWQPYYDALVAYQNKNGHCRVSNEDDPKLYQWLRDQQTSYQALKAGRKTKLTRKRAVALELIGAIPPEILLGNEEKKEDET